MGSNQYLLGYDVGSSFVKASLLNIDTGKHVVSASAPDKEMEMTALKPGWAEQDPEIWWQQIVRTTQEIVKKVPESATTIRSIGISYQMHGLVAVDKDHNVIRPSIIWCDSRAVEIGKKAFDTIGHETALDHFLNSPGNFTASKLKWVQQNEPEKFDKIHKIMLPGDFIALKLTGAISTTFSGLSEGILWDFKKEGLADLLLDHYNIPSELIPEAKPTFEIHGEVQQKAADILGIKAGIPVAYKAGDQPNNAFSLNVLEPGEVAATAGTSGVIYGVTDKKEYDPKSRVNTFVHVNHQPKDPHYGILLCLNGTGILNSWLKRNLPLNATDWSYEDMNHKAEKVPAGSENLFMFPFGNGAERILENIDIGAQLRGLQFNRHTTAHVLRAAQEGVVFALKYGFQIMNQMGMKAKTIKAGHANMFLSKIFRETFVNLTGATLKLIDTDGALGAARGAGIGAKHYANKEEAFTGQKVIAQIEPEKDRQEHLRNVYGEWLAQLENELH